MRLPRLLTMPILQVEGYPTDACTTNYTTHAIVEAQWLVILTCGCGLLVCNDCKQHIDSLPASGRCPIGHHNDELIKIIIPIDEHGETFKQLVDHNLK